MASTIDKTTLINQSNSTSSLFTKDGLVVKSNLNLQLGEHIFTFEHSNNQSDLLCCQMTGCAVRDWPETN